MGFSEDDRIRRKNAEFNSTKPEVVVQCKTCRAEFGSTKKDSGLIESIPCPQCNQKTLHIPD